MKDSTSSADLFTEYLESQEFHELCMDYRGSSVFRAQPAFEALQESIDAAHRRAPAAGAGGKS